MALRDLIPWNNGSRDLSLHRNEPNPFLALHREMNRLFDDAFHSFDIAPFSSHAMGWPSVEVNETDKEVKVIAELPGLQQKDVNVELRDGLLTISGERRVEKEAKGWKYHRMERAYGSFARTFQLPEHADSNKVNAQFKDGVLTLIVGKSEKARAKQIEVKIN